MKALSIQQPWAWAITDLDKRVENRPRATNFRGEIFLHASKVARDIEDLRGQATTEEVMRAYQAQRDGSMVLGAIVGVAEIYGCVGACGRGVRPMGHGSTVEDRWVEGPLCYLLRNVVKLPEPVPCKGALGFWKVPPDVEAEVRRQLAMAKKSKKTENVGSLDETKKRLEQAPAPAAAAAKGPEEPRPNSPEDLGYGGRDPKGKRGKRRLTPAEREQSELLAELISEDSRDVARAEEVRKKASEPLKEARARLKKHLAQLEVVHSGNWSPGLFEQQEKEAAEAADGDGSDE